MSPSASPTSKPSIVPSDSPSQVPSSSPTNIPTLLPSNAPSSSPTAECHDFPGTFTLDFSGDQKECNYLLANPTKAELRKDKYCGRDNLISLCPASCSYCTCADDPTYSFELNFSGETRQCEWITANVRKTATRRAKYCNDDYNNGVVKFRCAAACEICTVDPAALALANDENIFLH